jgi:hypothetical protein
MSARQTAQVAVPRTPAREAGTGEEVALDAGGS